MKKLYMAFVVLAALSVSACGVIPKNTAMFGAVTIDAVSPGAQFANSDVRPLKRGEATQTGIVLYVTGDSSIEAAMKNGGIKKVHHVDYKNTTILFLYTKTTTIVWGE